nr:unnamed protein product [Callosobruchus analis]
MAKNMEEIEDVNKRILKNRNETEKLKAELQGLINEGLGLGDISKLQQQNECKDVKDPPPKKVQIIKAYDGQCSSQIAKKEKMSEVPSKECLKKVKPYNVEEAREYIKKQRQKRLEQLKLNSKENKQQTEIKQKKLQELHKKAIELVQKNVDANKRSRSKSRERTDYIRLDTDHLPRSKSASKISSIKNEQMQFNLMHHESKSMKISKIKRMPESKSVKVLQNISLVPASNFNLKHKALEIENGLCPRDINITQDVQCDNIRISKETQTTKPEKHFPKWLQETPIESSPHNVINTFRKKLEYAATCPKIKIDIGVQNSLYHKTGQDIPELQVPTTPKCLNLDPKTVEHFELKCSASPSMSYLSESESDTSKNIPDISSESGASLKKITESAKNNAISDVSLSINTYKIDNMQLKKGRTITIQSESPIIVITDESGDSFNYQKLEDRKKSIISFGSPEGQGYRCSKDNTSSSIKTDTQSTPTHSKNIPTLTSKSINATPQNGHSSKSYHHKSSSQISRAYKGNKSSDLIKTDTTQSNDCRNKSHWKNPPSQSMVGSMKQKNSELIKTDHTHSSYKNHYQKSPSEISKSNSKEHRSSDLIKTDSTLQRPDIFINTRRGSAAYSIENDLFVEDQTSEAIVSKNKGHYQKSPSHISKAGSKEQNNSELIKTDLAQSSYKNYCQKSISQISKPTSEEHMSLDLRKTDSTHNLLRPDIFVNTRRGSGSYSTKNELFEENETSKASESDSDINREISYTNHSKVELSGDKITSVERNSDKNNAAEILPLKEPTVSLSTIDKNRVIHDDNSRVLKNICVGSNRQDENPNEIHLKFEAEIHLLNDFNESLRQFAEVEKAFETLKNNNVNKKYLASKDTQTSVKSLDNSEHLDIENSIISSVNYSRGSISEAHVISALESSDSSVILTGLELSNVDISNKSSSVKSCVEKLDLFEQLIKDEDARLENLKTILKIREQSLLDRTKGELAWLEIQRKHLKETGKLQEASTVKKRQRGILLNLQKERNEMQRLKQMQKAASAERKTELKEQSKQLRKQLVTTNMMSKMKINTPRERRLSGPIKVLQSKTESIRSETSMSKISSDREKEVYSIASHQSIVSRVSEFSEIEVSSKALESEVENKQAFIRKNLLMKEAALSKRRKAAEELLQCHQKLLEEEKRVVELESMAKSIICPKNDVTQKRKTWSVPTPISIPKQSDKTSVEYTSDFEVESIVDAVDQNIRDLMSDFSKVQDNISMLGISKSSKSDEEANKEEENSVIETKKPDKISTGTISSISSSADISERVSKKCARTSEAPSHIDGELSVHTIREHSVVPEVSENISSLVLPKSDEKVSTTPEVSEKISQLSNYVSNAVSEQIYEKIPSNITETNYVPEKLTKSIDGNLATSTDEVSQHIVSKQSQVMEHAGISEKISELPNESQGSIKSDITSASKTSVKLSEEILNSLQGHGGTSNTSSAASLHISSKELPETENLSSIPKSKSNSQNTNFILSEEIGSKKTKSMTTDGVSVLLNSAQEEQNDISKISISAAYPHTLSKKSDDKISEIPEDLEKYSDSFSVIEDLTRTLEPKRILHSAGKIVHKRSVEDRSTTNGGVSEDVSDVLQEERDKASQLLSSAASIHRSDKSLPEEETDNVSVVPELIKEVTDSVKASHISEEILYKDSIKETLVPDSSHVASKSEIVPKLPAEPSSAEVTEKFSEISRSDSKKLKDSGASETLSNISSAELNGNILASLADDIVRRDCTSKSSSNKTQFSPDKVSGKLSGTSADTNLVESETPSDGVIENLLEAYQVTQGLQHVPNLTEDNKNSEVLPSDASRISTEILCKDEGELAPKSTISGIIEEALQEVYGIDETVYKYFKRNSDEATATEENKNAIHFEKSESTDQKKEIVLKAEETHLPCRSESIVEQLQNDEIILEGTDDPLQNTKLFGNMSGNRENFRSEADDKANEKSMEAVVDDEKAYSRAELSESELKDIIHKTVKKGLLSVLESATNLNRALEGTISEHFEKTADEHKSTELRYTSVEETSVPYESDETEQKSLIEKDSLKETDIDEELSLDASEEHNIITSLTLPDKIGDTSISKSSSNNGICDLSYGAVETSFTKEINSYEEKEQDSLSPQNDEDPASAEEVCSVSQESVKIVDVKKRVLEIMVDANLTRGDKSPRLQDIYTTTYDLASPTNSPEYEAEEIFKKQLAIEQEIKAITEQQQKEQQLSFLFVREIPNKPPPPYTPPSSLPPVPPVQPIVPTRDEIDEITKYASKILYKAHLGGKLEKVTISDSTLDLIGTTISKDRYRFVFDLCKEICRWHYEQFEESTFPSWLKVSRKLKLAVEKPLDAAGLEKHMTKKLRELYGYEKPIIRENAIIKWCKKKRNNIDEILITESLQEESQWTTFEKDERLVMDHVTNEIMNMLLIKETEEIFRNVFCRKIL